MQTKLKFNIDLNYFLDRTGKIFQVNWTVTKIGNKRRTVKILDPNAIGPNLTVDPHPLPKGALYHIRPSHPVIYRALKTQNVQLPFDVLYPPSVPTPYYPNPPPSYQALAQPAPLMPPMQPMQPFEMFPQPGQLMMGPFQPAAGPSLYPAPMVQPGSYPPPMMQPYPGPAPYAEPMMYPRYYWSFSFIFLILL